MPTSHSPTITSGRFRGRRLQVPPGRSTRPTRSLVRQALFNMLGPDALEDADVLDLYSGSGALGLEALSRGARRVLFVERGRGALKALRENLEACGVGPEEGRIHPGNVLTLPLGDVGPFDLVLADPPFAVREALPASLEDQGVLSPEARLAIHTPTERPGSPPVGPGWEEDRSRVHGRSSLFLFSRRG